MEDACRLLAEHGGGMDSLTHAVRAGPGPGDRWGVGGGRARPPTPHLPFPLPTQGQRPCDLADEEVLSLLEELARKQEDVSVCLQPGGRASTSLGTCPSLAGDLGPVGSQEEGHSWALGGGGALGPRGPWDADGSHLSRFGLGLVTPGTPPPRQHWARPCCWKNAE